MNRLGAMIGTRPVASASSVQHAARAAPMVGVGVGEDHGGDRAQAAVLEIKLHRGARAFDRGQRVHHDDAAIALDQRHVGDVEAADLVDAGHHLEQPVLHVQPRLPPQARVDGGGRLLLRQEAIGLETPDHAPLRVGDPRMVDRAHEAARGIVEIRGVGKRQRLEHRGLLRDDGGGGVLGSFLRSFAGGCCGHGVVLLAYRDIQSRKFVQFKGFILRDARSLSSGAHSRDPLAPPQDEVQIFFRPKTLMVRSAATPRVSNHAARRRNHAGCAAR